MRATPRALAVSLLLVGMLARATDPEPGQAPPASPPPVAKPKGVRGWYGFPGPFYTPETRLGLALVGGVHFGVDQGLDTSTGEVIVYGTQNRQASVRLTGTVFVTPRLVVDGKVEAQLFPAPYYGIGKDAPSDAEEQYTNRSIEVSLAPEWRLAGNLRAGPRVRLRREVAVKRDADGVLAGSALPGASSWGAAGIGPTAVWDVRDDRFQPRAGGYVEAAYLYYPSALVAGAGAFGLATLDVRWFFGPLPRHTLGLQVMLEAAHGAVPVVELPNIGGDDTFRGYVDGRYRDRLSYSTQAEWRFPIAGRFRGTVFAGAGNVAHEVGDLAARPFRYAGGAGLRFRLTSTGAYLRVDGAYAEDGLQIYFLTMEAF